MEAKGGKAAVSEHVQLEFGPRQMQFWPEVSFS